MSQSISKERIKQIINEEINRRIFLNENQELDIEAIEAVSKNAKILLKAAYEFRNNAPPTLINHFTPSLGEMIEKLENMIKNPTTFVSAKKPELPEQEKSQTKPSEMSDFSMGPRGGETVKIKPKIK